MQECEQLGHKNRINEDASGMEVEPYYPTHNAVLKSSSSATRVRAVFNTPLQSFTPIYYTINNFTGFVAMVSEHFGDGASHVFAANGMLWCSTERAEVPRV